MSGTSEVEAVLPEAFQAVVAEDQGGEIAFAPQMIQSSTLPEGEVVIEVEYSTVNYKDMLALTPNGKVVRGYPIVPGIDLAGTVVSSTDASLRVGQPVVAHGYQLGTARAGGYAQYARVPAEWVVPLHDSMTTWHAMALGTAGFTAAMSVVTLLDAGIRPDDGPVLVTGASGGVGTVAVDILASLGYTVTASSGKDGAGDLLRKLGAAQVIGRIPEDPDAKSGPLESASWVGAIDTVGGETLAHILRTLKYRGHVAASGNAAGISLPVTVLPFILRGVTLHGIDSVQVPITERRQLWNRLSDDLRPQHLDLLTTEYPVSELPEVVSAIAAGTNVGRPVLRIKDGFTPITE
ncbi:acryloyl-CoA reductase [Nesterenkonia sp. CL21]|uniref:acrylyl-CoA reductase family protein n=1 Tax=Nesterenkonia sp. CL21 TaxID=3064894 RepID=UPI00287B4D31|nr:acryloyl-CoA reductase [Nesterenkonia sp. CL21]MDS2171465.1 acryloyl-CoA reductase [Nesterenkonia sp. CL21]